jgi:single-stranded-DNA-specific exonuclease
MQWQYTHQSIPETLGELTEVLLKNRSITDVEEFFHPSHPQTLTLQSLGFNEEQVALAVSKIKQACADEKDILIFGDYDADGICATATLWEALKDLGCTARPFIPHREKHGYGLTVAALQEIIEQKKPDLIITVDNAIVAHAAAQYAAEQQVPLIITDHHQPEVDKDGKAYFPQAEAIVHTTKLCGTTVAWILARELGSRTVKDSLDLCGLATISDQVPLKAANRSFAYHGIKALQLSHRMGLRALFQQAAIKPETIDGYTVGFVISPRINAMGRLAHGMDALRLLCTQNKGRAAQLADTLANMNVERQDITQTQLEEAMLQVAVQSEESIVIAESSEFHEGVIGLIAGRLVEKYAKPALVMSISEKGIKGSARSLKGINITELLRGVREHLLEVGGHPMAGGFSVSHEKLEIFKTAVFTLARKTIDKQMLIPTKVLECQIPFSLVGAELCVLMDKFAPFGSENNKPLFSFGQLTVVGKQALGKEGKHLKLLLESPESTTGPIEALYWRNGHRLDEFSVGQQILCAGQVECSVWKGTAKIQIIIKDLILDSAAVL